LYQFAAVSSWELQYGMNNVNQATAPRGAELLIKNKHPSP